MDKPLTTSRKGLIFFSNILIILLVTIFILFYINVNSEREKSMAAVSFRSVNTTIEKVTSVYMNRSRTFVDNYAFFIKSTNYTIEEAIERMRNLNIEEDIGMQIINYDTFKGYSTKPDANGSYEVDYSNFNEHTKNIFLSLKNTESEYTSNFFDDPITGKNVIAYCKDIILDMTKKNGHALLLRLVPIDSIKENWVFPTFYSQTITSIIDTKGNYILKANTVENDNFFDFIASTNNETEPSLNKLKQEIAEKSSVFIRTGRFGVERFFASSKLDGKDGWILLSSIPVSACLETENIQWFIVISITIGLLILFILDLSIVLRMNKKLALATKNAQQASEAKTKFLSSMSHDIRTPMNAIIGMTTIGMKYIDEKDRVKECLKKVTLASNHLLTLVNDILDISKVESGKFTLNPIVFSLANSATNLVSIVQSQINEKELTFDVHTRNMRHEFVFADELRLNQIFINILTNAVKYTKFGGKIIVDFEQEILPENPELVKLIYRVKDNGIGMSKELQKTMYNSFVRGEDSRINVIQGSGLGLSITKQMVDLMKGTIECESEIGKGTTFTVTINLPIATQITKELVLPPMEILVADDDDIFLETAVDCIETLGAKADIAHNGKEAVEKAVYRHKENRDYPIAIIDWRMPEMDGVSTVREMRKQLGPEIPIIIISNYDWSSIEKEAILAGANGFIAKPLFRSTLYSKLNDFLHFEKEIEKPKNDIDESLKGIHILVAEDNEMNWEIAKEMLEIHHITADRAKDGQEAVEMLKNAPEDKYACILMDIQMPIMNGRQATKLIRKFENPVLRNIPIIAMTADAFAEDRIACLDAGMNGHISKPVDMKNLLSEMKKLLIGGGYKGIVV